MLHLITFDYKYSPKQATIMSNFLETLPFILPCKYCRASLTDYYREHPFEHEQLAPSFDLKRWMYKIHNCVNEKLRKQGLNPSSDPPYQKVKEFYETWRKCEWKQQLITFWDFLFAVAYNHPVQTAHHSKPMPDCPAEVYQCKDKCEKNKWNVLPMKDRMYWYKRFWSLLPAVLPVEIGKRWKEVERIQTPTLHSRRSALAWLWRIRCSLDSDFQDPYTSVCQRIASFSSDCGKKKRAITCRKRRMGKTVKNKK